MKIVLVVKVISEGRLSAAYARDIELPFVPTIGMKFKQGVSCWLWETQEDTEFPPVKEIVYNLDEEIIYCLFEVHDKLKSSFWIEIKNLGSSIELSQFEINS